MATLEELEAELARRQGATSAPQTPQTETLPQPVASLELLEAEAVKRNLIQPAQSTFMGDVEQVAALASNRILHWT